MAANRAQRISIWIIAIALAIGTIGSFVVIILANDNARMDRARVTELEQQFQSDYAKFQASVEEEKLKWPKEYYSTLAEYRDRPSEFDADSVTEIKTEDLKEGDGEVVNKADVFYAFYIGWNPNGEVFDSSFIEGNNETLKEPFAVQEGYVISGWTEGLEGIKSGGVRELTLPADKAYGEAGSGELVEPGMPLKFIVLVINPKAPEIPQELIDYYTRGVI